MSGYAGGIRSDLPATYRAALNDRYSLQPPLPPVPTSDRPYSTQSFDYFLYSPQRQRREYQSDSLTRSNSFSSIYTRRVYSAQPRRMANTIRASNRSAILAVGEELRQLLHAEDDPPVLKDRRYHLKTYATCFIGHEMVDWLLKKGEVESRSEAVAMMQKLLENEVIHHVCDDHDFKDEKLFYRFRRDDNTYEEPPDAMIVAKGQRIYSRLKTDGSNLIQDRKYHLQTFKQSFIGREFVDWLITRGEVSTREEGTQLGRQFVDAGVFRHVCDDHHFKDEYLFFRFKNDDPKSQKTFGKRVGVAKSRGKRLGSMISSEQGSENRNSDISFESSSASDQYMSGGSTSPQENDDEYIAMQSAVDPEYLQMQAPSEPTYISPADPPTFGQQQSYSDITIEELTDPNGRFIKRSVDIVSDPVGYGFVIRGSRPVYVHTVDPSGPAASIGLQVGEYLYSVNGQYVLDKSHTDVARIILMGTSTAYLVTFIDKDRVQSS
ncbi:PREDICTED: DEP domain-containing mTOR-interacting protein-like [Amphimedon queenslandica]|uniref:DEP domain-containing protein n=1 Tax=Amphimedon queenslandica TaxID=400682 RepID=A0A1X7UG62_AMPQE|nr:PREDICTED: DEP domain-containing mTOR-interacting protein-like [Amphimedon queenslandica]|eukprot:XP_019854510.1 PREDICTED: DEP domain-containing mTOR-interacting protein-like [Amphimedon queenslandica]